MLAQRRLTEAGLWTRLARRGYPDDEVREAVAAGRRAGFLDDALFARLFIETRASTLGDARVIAELVRRGITQEAAATSLAAAERGEPERLEAAYAKLVRRRPTLGYANAARALERLGFPAPAIYRCLSQRARAELAPPRAD